MWYLKYVQVKLVSDQALYLQFMDFERADSLTHPFIWKGLKLNRTREIYNNIQSYP